MKNPNGYGSVKKLSGNRRRPYIFVVSEAGKRHVIGYYATQVEALSKGEIGLAPAVITGPSPFLTHS